MLHLPICLCVVARSSGQNTSGGKRLSKEQALFRAGMKVPNWIGNICSVSPGLLFGRLELHVFHTTQFHEYLSSSSDTDTARTQEV